VFAVWFGVVASASAAIEIVGETHATFAWNPPTGVVAGYDVFVSRNGGPADLHSTVTDTNRQTIHGSFGDAIQISTAAFDGYGNTGPRSDLSEGVRFVEAPAPTPRATATPFPTPMPTPTPTLAPTSAPTLAPTSAPTSTSTPTPTRSPVPSTTISPTDEPRPSDDPLPNEGPATAYDFNGDGHSDILFRNATTGELDCWQMVGSEIVDVTALPSMDRGWRTAAAGDFDSDGTTDILLYDDGSSTARIWLMGDSAGDGEFDVRLPAGWVVAGAGDFDGDGRDEIAIWNQTARLEIWGLRGELVRLARISIRKHSEIAGFGDIDGDGDDDIIFQDLRKRRIEASLMSAGFSTQRVLLDKQRTARWDVIESGDYDGDGQSDLLWRDLSWGAPGNAGVWHLSSSLELSGNPLDLNLGIDHSVVGSADYDGDGSADLLIFNPSTRELVLWLMAEAGPHKLESLGTVATDWLPVGFDTDDAATR
jgi:hypothetical protein